MEWVLFPLPEPCTLRYATLHPALRILGGTPVNWSTRPRKGQFVPWFLVSSSPLGAAVVPWDPPPGLSAWLGHHAIGFGYPALASSLRLGRIDAARVRMVTVLAVVAAICSSCAAPRNNPRSSLQSAELL